MNTFGVDFHEHLKATKRHIPIIVTKCINEIDERGKERRVRKKRGREGGRERERNENRIMTDEGNGILKLSLKIFLPILGLNTQGLYRISSAKSKMEKLCQLFEAGSERVDLSDLPPHLISSCLKLYFRQVGREREILLLFKFGQISLSDHGL